MATPNGNTSQVQQDVSRGVIINAINWLGVSLSIIFVAARVYTRTALMRDFGWDDALLIIATILNITGVAITSAAVTYGLGRHIAFVNPDQVSKILHLVAVMQPIGIVAYCLPKLSIVIFLRKLVGYSMRGLPFFYFIFFVLFVSSILSFTLVFAQCDPPDHFWHPTERAKCINPAVLEDTTLFAGSWSAFTDLVLALYPATVFWNLKMKTSRKIGISAVMGLGILAMVCAIIKTSQLPKESSADFTWEFFGLLITTWIESDVVTICACVPVLPKLVRHIRGTDSSQVLSENQNYYNSSSKTATNAILPQTINRADYEEFDDESRPRVELQPLGRSTVVV